MRRRTTLKGGSSHHNRRGSVAVRSGYRDRARLRQSVATLGIPVDPFQGLWDEDDDAEEEEEDTNNFHEEHFSSDLSFFADSNAIKDASRRSGGMIMEDDTTMRPTSVIDEEDPSPVTASQAKAEAKPVQNRGVEWKTVNTLFNYLDIDNSGTLEKEEIVHGLQVIGDTNLTRVLVDASVDQGRDVIDRETLYNMLFAPREPTRYQPMMLWLITWVLPLFYSASTRLPFICLALEVTVAREGTLLQTGILLGVYQTCRSMANLLISLGGGEHPMLRLQVPMVLTGFIAWAVSYVLVDGGVWSLFAMAGVGLGEVVVNLQTALIEETRLESPAHVADPGVLSERLRSQYASISAGSFLAYVLGGSLYTYYGFSAVCAVGMACNAVQLFGTLLFLAGYRHRQTLRVDISGVTGRQLLRSITYRIQAMLVLGREAERISTQAITVDKPDIAQASKSAEQDILLTDSVRKLYRAFFLSQKTAECQADLENDSRRRVSTIASVPIQRMLSSAVDLTKRNTQKAGGRSSEMLTRSSGLSGTFENSLCKLLVPGMIFKLLTAVLFYPKLDVDFAKVAARLIDTDGDGVSGLFRAGGKICPRFSISPNRSTSF